LLDVGEANTIHPLDKKTPGERLAALVQAQGPLSPVYKAMEIEGDKIRVIFGQKKLGLVAASLPESYRPKSDETATLPLTKNSPNSQLQGFAICGSDRMWKWADARIEGDSVIVSSPAVPAPVAVRYAWAANPTINLNSTAGHPIPPFRTDSFEVITQDREY
jgi:sialate O-acetylesterase